MDSNEDNRPPEAPEQRDDGRLRIPRRFLPIAGVVGAFGIVASAVLRPGEAAPAQTPRNPTPPAPPPVPPVPPASLPQRYTRAASLAGPGTAGEFTRSLHGLAVGPRDAVYALGDGEVRVFDGSGRVVRRWQVAEASSCLGVAADGRVVVGSPGRVDIFNATGARVGGFVVGTPEKPAAVTAIRVAGDLLLLADAAARVIRKYDVRGAERGVIGAQNKTGGFMLPNRSLDFDVDAAGVVHAADSGRHQVTSWTVDGAMVASFGRFGMVKPEDFVGCCNPVNLAVAPDGSIVTAEKAVARLKVFGRDRGLLAVIGPEHFDPMCRHIHVAVDSTGRVVAGDPERRAIAVFGRV